MPDFLPVTPAELRAAGIQTPDFVLVTGDAYVDHPSFGAAIIGRVLQARGYSVAMLAQPRWREEGAFTAFGRPRLGFLVTGGNIDSMVAHYTVAKKPRSRDLYSPGGRAGLRPDRAASVYAKAVKAAFPDCPVILGGREASLRRFAHYDYWDDAVRPPLLAECRADLLVYGMGEAAIAEIAARLASGEPAASITNVRGTCVLLPAAGGGFQYPAGTVVCPSFEKVRTDRRAYADAFRMQYEQQDAVTGKPVAQRSGEFVLLQNPPEPQLSGKALDAVYALPFTRRWHPMYDALGGVPALDEVEFSIAHNRGCFGACAFCAIAFHQGRGVTARSHASVLSEAREMTRSPRFKGYIHDVGGPTANLRGPSCDKQAKAGMCKHRRCLTPAPCPALKTDHSDYLRLLRELRALPGVKRVFVRSGLRFDYILAEKNDAFLDELVRHHVSGQLKVAPEHCSPGVLDCMGKPHIGVYKAFADKFYALTKRAGLEQYLVPYLMSSHPGSTLNDAIELALFLKRERIRPEQVQDFYPTPGTLSTCMFSTGLDPMPMQPVYVPREGHEKAMQRALLQPYLPQNRSLVLEALERAGRRDLIGTRPGCLIAPGGNGGGYARSVANRQPSPQSGRERLGAAAAKAPQTGKKPGPAAGRGPQGPSYANQKSGTRPGKAPGQRPPAAKGGASHKWTGGRGK